MTHRDRGKLVNGGYPETNSPPSHSTITPPSFLYQTSPLNASNISNLQQIDGNISLTDSLPSIDTNPENFNISVHISSRSTKKVNFASTINSSNLITIRRCDKLIEAANLPTVITLNPRSLYNKREEFATLVDQVEAKVCFVSETWERSHKENAPLISEILDIDGLQMGAECCGEKSQRGETCDAH